VDTRTANREASQVGLGVVKERIGALARFYAELGIEPPSKIPRSRPSLKLLPACFPVECSNEETMGGVKTPRMRADKLYVKAMRLADLSREIVPLNE
jgi:hypothetical protein